LTAPTKVKIAAARAAALIACLWFVLPLSRSGEPEPRPAAFSHLCSRPLCVLGVCTVRCCIAAPSLAGDVWRGSGPDPLDLSRRHAPGAGGATRPQPT